MGEYVIITYKAIHELWSLKETHDIMSTTSPPAPVFPTASISTGQKLMPGLRRYSTWLVSFAFYYIFRQ